MSAGEKERPTLLLSQEERIIFETDNYRITTEMSVREVLFPNMEGPTYLIEYRGRDGASTKREIIVQWINEGKTTVWITAYCKLRKEVRKFNSENIVSITDLQSGGGTIADPTEYFRLLNRHGF